eukprot:6158085-Amphidinium_carterae.2
MIKVGNAIQCICKPGGAGNAGSDIEGNAWAVPPGAACCWSINASSSPKIQALSLLYRKKQLPWDRAGSSEICVSKVTPSKALALDMSLYCCCAKAALDNCFIYKALEARLLRSGELFRLFSS